MDTGNSWIENNPPRLGDLIDDYCPRCKRLMNHAIASFVGDKVVKVVCRTCYTEHPYLEGKEKKKAPKSTSTAFEQVLAKVSPPSTPPEAPTRKKTKAKSGVRSIYRHKDKEPGKKE